MMSFSTMDSISWKFTGQPYDLNSVLTPDQVWAKLDVPAEEVRQSLILLINALNAQSASSNVGFTPNASVGDANTVQTAFDTLVSLLHGTGGAAWLKSVGVAGLTGDNVQALLESLKAYIDTKNTAQTSALNTHKNSSDHDSRYYTEAEIDTKVTALNSTDTANSIALTAHKVSSDHDSRYYTETESDTKFETISDLTNNRKLSATGDFRGTLNGYPIVQADPGYSSMVAGINDTLNAHLAENVQKFIEVDADILTLQTDKAEKISLDSEATSRQNNDANLQSQINAIVLTGTSGDSSAEVAQARTNIEGAIFPTVKSHLDNIENSIKTGVSNFSFSWVQGGTDTNNGNDTISTTRIRSNYVNSPNGVNLTVTPASGYKMVIERYTRSGETYTFANAYGSFQTAKTTYYLDPAYYYRFMIGKADDSTIVPSDAFHVTFTIPFEKVIPTNVLQDKAVILEKTDFANRINYFNKNSADVVKDYWKGTGTGGYITGASSVSANYFLTNIISVNPGDVIRFYPVGSTKNICFAGKDGIIQQNLFISDPVNGVTVPDGCYYARVVLNYNMLGWDETLNRTIISINRELPNDYLTVTYSYDNFYTENLVVKNKQIKSQWNGKICAAIGSSLTEMEGWHDKVKSFFNLSKLYNRGSGGTTLADFHNYAGVTNYVSGMYVYDDSNLWQEDRHTCFYDSNNIPAGYESAAHTTWVDGWYSSEGRINLLPTDADLVLIDLATNDFFRSVNKDYITEDAFVADPIIQTAWNEGQTPTTYDVTKFCGAFMMMIKRIMARCPNAKIVVWGMPMNGTIMTADGSLDYFYRLLDVIKKMCDRTGAFYIDTVREMGINVYNLRTYMTDDVHPATTEKGKKALADVLISNLKNIFPKDYDPTVL